MALTQVQTGMIADAAVTTAKIADANISAAKLASGAARANFGAGAVLQVVQGTSTTEVSSSSGAWVTTGLSATITPTSSTSKILVLVTLPFANNATSGGSAFLSIYRNSTNLGVGSYNSLAQSFAGASSLFFNVVMDTLDSPATTSATTYTAYMQAYASQVVTAMINTVGGRIILLEIAA